MIHVIFYAEQLFAWFSVRGLYWLMKYQAQTTKKWINTILLNVIKFFAESMWEMWLGVFVIVSGFFNWLQYDCKDIEHMHV